MKTEQQIESRIRFLEEEYEKEEQYGQRGDTSSIAQAIRLLKWVLTSPNDYP